jgi:hypothetical protein
MGIEQEKRDLAGIETGNAGDLRERRGVRVAAMLIRRNDVTGRSPSLRKAMPIVGVRSARSAAGEPDKDSCRDQG